MGLLKGLYSAAKDYAADKACELLEQAANSEYKLKLTNNGLALNIKSPNKSKIELIVEDDGNGGIKTSDIKMKLETPIGTINYRK